MADQLCGPSNALQNFQKHSSADRTLQQDRLQHRASPNQAFRTNPSANAAAVNREFEAFQAGQPLHENFSPNFNYAGPSQSTARPGPNAWADDFQRLNISPMQNHQSYTPQQIPGTQSSWHQDFLQQSQQPQMPDHGYNVPLERLSNMIPQPGQYQPMMGGSMFANSSYNMPIQHEQQMPQPHMQAQVETFDEEAFARAFDEAAQNELAEQHVESQEAGVLLDRSAERILEDEPVSLDQAQNLPRIGADLIHDPQGATDQHANDDPDALSRTAGELLTRVSGNTSEKFANSQFLELMRQLRDKEMIVQGDRIVETAEGMNTGLSH